MVTLTSLTVYKNTSAADGGGVYVDADNPNLVSVDNNIFDGNTVPAANGGVDPDFFVANNTVADKGFNLIGTGDTGFAEETDILNDNPGLQNFLANNGALAGFPQTLAMLTAPGQASPGYEAGEQALATQGNPQNIDAGGLIRQSGFVNGTFLWVSIGAMDPDALYPA